MVLSILFFQNSFKTVTSEQFKEFFFTFFQEKLSDEQRASIEDAWGVWMNRPGMPVRFK